MDATQFTKKTALFLAVALLVAGAASAADTLQTNLGASPAITLANIGNPFQDIQVTSSGAPITFTIENKSGPWFSVSPSSLTTPSTIRVQLIGDCTVSAVGCTAGKFDIKNGADVITVSVTQSSTIGGGGNNGNGLLSSSPSSLTLTAANGSFAYNNTALVISTTSTTTLALTMSVSPQNSWLQVFPATANVNNTTTATLSVIANATSLANNTTYTGSIIATPASGSALTIPVTFVVGTGSATSGTLTASPSSLTLSYPTGISSQNVLVSSSSATSFSATSNSTWLLVNGAAQASSIAVGNNIVLSVNPTGAAGLTTGTYNGLVTLANTNNTADTTQISVVLSVNGATGGTTTGLAAPTPLAFAYQAGKSAPCQLVLVPAAGSYTVSTTGIFYTNVNDFSGPGSVVVCPVAGRAAGNYDGSVTISSASLYQTIPVTLRVYADPVINVAVNGTGGDIICTYQAGVTGCNASSLNVTSSDNSSLNITVTPSASWVTVSGTATTTPGQFTVQLNTAGLPNGMNTASIAIASADVTTGTVNVPVAVYVTGNSSTGNLTLSPASLTFTSASSQTVSVAAATATAFTVSVPSTCTWLSATASGTTTQNITVTTTSSGLTAGTSYSCNINLTAGGVTQTLPVTFSVAAASSVTVTVDKTQLSFTAQQGIAPATQTLHVTSTAGAAATSFSVSSEFAPWLTFTPSSGTTPADITVGVNPAGLGLGANSGMLIITPTGGTSTRVNVALTVVAATSVSATPASLSFTYVAGGSNPAAQQIQVTGSAQNLPFSAQVTSGSEWLSVTPATGTAPATLAVSVNPASLSANKTYNGTIVVAGTGTATGSTTINVTLEITAPLPTITRVTNGASFNTGSIAAGEIITLFGTAIGPATLQTPASTSPTGFPTTLGGVQVTIGGYPAPLIYVRNDQVAAIVPYEVNRPFITSPVVIVKYLGQTSNGVNTTQVGAAPGIFTVGGGTGQGAILNQDLSVNSAGNPANKGDVVVLYVTGEGQTNPAGVSGAITAVSATTPQPVSGRVGVTIGGQPAQVLFYGEAPGLVSGVMQVNVRVPAGAASGDQPVVVTVGDAPSQTDARGVGAVTVAVR